MKEVCGEQSKRGEHREKEKKNRKSAKPQGKAKQREKKMCAVITSWYVSVSKEIIIFALATVCAHRTVLPSRAAAACENNIYEYVYRAYL